MNHCIQRGISRPASDLREGIRWPVALRIQVRELRMCALDVDLQNISICGCGVRAGFRLKVGGEAVIVIPGFRSFRAVTIWSRDWHAGFRFASPLHPAVVRHITMLGRQAEDVAGRGGNALPLAPREERR